MGKVVFVVLTAWLAGLVLGDMLSGAEIAWWRKRVRELQKMLKDKNKPE